MLKYLVSASLFISVMLITISVVDQQKVTTPIPQDSLPSIGLCKEAARVMEHTKGHSKDTIRRADAIVKRCNELSDMKKPS